MCDEHSSTGKNNDHSRPSRRMMKQERYLNENCPKWDKMSQFAFCKLDVIREKPFRAFYLRFVHVESSSQLSRYKHIHWPMCNFHVTSTTSEWKCHKEKAVNEHKKSCTNKCAWNDPCRENGDGPGHFMLVEMQVHFTQAINRTFLCANGRVSLFPAPVYSCKHFRAVKSVYAATNDEWKNTDSIHSFGVMDDVTVVIVAIFHAQWLYTVR